MNGKPGDDPALDILHHHLRVYSVGADALVRDLAKLMELRQLQELLASLQGLPVEELEKQLTAKLHALRTEARARGWEVDG